jgi:beta-glucosidase
MRVSHHLLLSHGWAVPKLRQNSPDAEVGIVVNINWLDAASPSVADREALRQADGWWTRWYIDPLVGRGYPADVLSDATTSGYLEMEGGELIQAGDLKAMATPLDFWGLNYYTRNIIRSRDIPEDENMPPTVQAPPQNETDWMEMGWEVNPEGLFKVLCRLHFEYRPPKIYITENGASYSDGPDESGRIRDRRRIQYYESHLIAAHRAMQAGVPLVGYFSWSLMDNFEWAHGYTQRFGNVWVDFETLERLPKDSARWFQETIAANGFTMQG